MSKTMILFFVSFLVRLHILTPIRVARLKFFYKLHRWPDFEHPKDINEKINWMKFYGDTTSWPLLADKYRVREYVAEKIGEEYLIPLIGKWDTVDEIDWDQLPQQFVMKCNNGSGDVVVCPDKKKLDKEKTLQYFRKTLQTPYGILTGEEHYKQIRPCIIAEELLDGSTQPNKSQSLVDYKIWCFNGKPEFIVCYGSRHDKYYCEIGVYDRNWNAHPEYLRYSSHYVREQKLMPKPASLDTMLRIASILSKEHPQMRVDLYDVNGHVYVGELTLTSSGGYMNHFTQAFLDKLGQFTVLPIDKMNKKKVIAVASIGGHWIQLQRIARPLEEYYEMVYVSTHPKCAAMVEGKNYYLATDFSRSNAWKLIPAFFRQLNIIRKEKPDAIITTGAAPGLICVFAGWLLRRKTIWIDSIANVNRLSLSGRIAALFVSRVYTQWQHLATAKIHYSGDIFG